LWREALLEERYIKFSSPSNHLSFG
jgi:hypothetical protein